MSAAEKVELLFIEILYLVQCLQNEPIRRAIAAAANIGLSTLELGATITN